MLRNCSSLNLATGFEGIDTTLVKSMGSMLRGLTTTPAPPDITGFNFSNTTSLNSFMLDANSMLTPPDFTGVDTSKVVSFKYAFGDWDSMTTTPNMSDISTISATSTYAMMRSWSSMTSPPDIGHFNMTKVTDIGDMCRNWTSMGEVDVDIDLWNVVAVTTAVSFLQDTTLTTACYDRVLIAWDLLTLDPALTSINFGNSKYSTSAAAAHASLLTKVGELLDGGPE